MIITGSNWRGLCAASSTAPQNEASPGACWDLDRGDLVSWSRALQTCEACPFKSLCAEERDELFAANGRPTGVIWAGVAYSDTGRVLDASGLRRLAASQRGRRLRETPAAIRHAQIA